MHMRPKIIAANWKMNKTLEEGAQLAKTVIQQLPTFPQHTTQIILIPSYIHLETIHKLLPPTGHIALGAQNCHESTCGPFTGEIASSMLQSVGVRFVLIGHSERRQYNKESPTLLARKATAALAHGIRPIFCCGEPEQIRVEGQTIAFIQQQLSDSLFHLSEAQIAQVIIAYEPIWAIGTGITPTPTQTQTIHAAIRSHLAQRYSKPTSQKIPILYGGSCNTQNAAHFSGCPDVDGGLIGSAALEADSFLGIVSAFRQQD